MGKRQILGVDVNHITLKTLLTDKTMYVAYGFLLLAIIGVIDVFYERYFLLSATAHDAGLSPGNRDVAMAMKEAVFGSGGEVKREAPWSLYIANYMYMIYTGSGIIFLVAFAEFFNIKIMVKAAAGFLTLGLAMVMAGLFTIMMDLNVVHLHWMILSPRFNSGMWLMLPLYAIYIPLVLFEIYLLITHKDNWTKKLAFPILILSLLIEFLEFYIQAKLFSMNLARNLWTSYPLLALYFIISSFVAASAVMMFYSFFTYKNINKKLCNYLMDLLHKVTLYSVIVLGFYEVIAYLMIDYRAVSIMLFGDFKFYLYAYFILTIMIPFALLFWNTGGSFIKLFAAIFIIVGTYLGRMVFVYGGNAYPLSDRFGVGFEKYYEYAAAKDVIFFMPPWGEIAIVIGSVGVVIFIYRIIDLLLSVSHLRQH